MSKTTIKERERERERERKRKKERKKGGRKIMNTMDTNFKVKS